MGGRMCVPHLLKEVRAIGAVGNDPSHADYRPARPARTFDRPPKILPIPRDQNELIVHAMWSVVNVAGTATGIKMAGFDIAGFGAWEIHNAQPTETFWQKQLIGLAVALVAMLAIAFTDYRRLVEIAPALYGVGLVLLVIVLIPHVGMKINGQRCWIKLPGAGQFQPSEFVKIPVVLMLARYFGKHRTGMLTWKELLLGGAILGLPIGLIMLEPDVGQ